MEANRIGQQESGTAKTNQLRWSQNPSQNFQNGSIYQLTILCIQSPTWSAHNFAVSRWSITDSQNPFRNLEICSIIQHTISCIQSPTWVKKLHNNFSFTAINYHQLAIWGDFPQETLRTAPFTNICTILHILVFGHSCVRLTSGWGETQAPGQHWPPPLASRGSDKVQCWR